MKRALHATRQVREVAFFLLFAAWIIPCLSLAAEETPTRSVHVSWALSPEEDVAGYRIHYGPVSRYDEQFEGYPYVADVRPGQYVVSDRTARYELTGLNKSQTLWVSVTSYDADGNESSFSNEKKLPKVIEVPGPIMPCQAVSPSCRGSSLATLLPGWVFLFLAVPLWILALRCLVTPPKSERKPAVLFP